MGVRRGRARNQTTDENLRTSRGETMVLGSCGPFR